MDRPDDVTHIETEHGLYVRRRYRYGDRMLECISPADDDVKPAAKHEDTQSCNSKI